MNLTEHFTLEELVYSAIAVEHGVDNWPRATVVRNLQSLAEDLLEPLRLWIGKGIAVTSGYRCEEVNRLAGGAKHSQHLFGEAADCYIPEGPVALLAALMASRLAFDQAITYRRKHILHLSYRKGNNRCQILQR